MVVSQAKSDARLLQNAGHRNKKARSPKAGKTVRMDLPPPCRIICQECGKSTRVDSVKEAFKWFDNHECKRPRQSKRKAMS